MPYLPHPVTDLTRLRYNDNLVESGYGEYSIVPPFGKPYVSAATGTFDLDIGILAGLRRAFLQTRVMIAGEQKEFHTDMLTSITLVGKCASSAT